jgi:hypothetical protein
MSRANVVLHPAEARKFGCAADAPIVAAATAVGNDAPMRLWLPGGVLLLVLASCAQRSPQRLMGDGELVLELGGAGASLSRMLQKSGVELLPAPQPIVQPAPHIEPKPKDGAGGEDSRGAKADPIAKIEPEPKIEPNPEPKAEPKPESGDYAFDVVVVQLGANETLMDVASKHLGTAKRFKDIMKWNGWSERETRRLKPGTEIKLQIPKKAAAPR